MQEMFELPQENISYRGKVVNGVVAASYLFLKMENILFGVTVTKFHVTQV